MQKFSNIAGILTVDVTVVLWGIHGCGRMVVGFTTTCAISAYHY
jgi:hypothetical protein